MKCSILFAMLMMASAAFAQSGGSMTAGKFPTSFESYQAESIQFLIRSVLSSDANGLLTVEVVDRSGQTLILKISESEIVKVGKKLYGVLTKVEQN